MADGTVIRDGGQRTQCEQFSLSWDNAAVSSNAATNGIVWVVENSSPAALHAYDAVTLQELYNSNQGANARDHFGNGNKFITPLVANGKVFVGSPSGVAVFGLLP